MQAGWRFTDAPNEYSREDEQQFRRELEQLVVVLAALLESLSRGTNAQASVHSRTKSFVFDDVGQENFT